MKHLDKLISIGSAAIGQSFSNDAQLPPVIVSMLAIKNGFYAFESALLVRHCGVPIAPMDCKKWNNRETWKELFEHSPSGFCFAENIFGEQFFWTNDSVWLFDPETSESNRICSTLDEWAECILDDYDSRTGYSLAKEWQATFGALQAGTKLIPQKPFVLGGEFELKNLKAESEAVSMRCRAAIANQIWNTPDGTPIKIELKG
jgi:hypothetical protein